MNNLNEPLPANRPVMAGVSIAIALIVVIVWIGAIAGVPLGLSPATAGVILLGTIPVALAGSAASLYALICRGENKQIVQYGLWTNGLLAFFAFPAMVIVVV